MVSKSLLLLAIAGSAIARTGPLGPQNNYLAPTGLEIGTISQTLLCNGTLSGLVVLKNAQFTLTLGGAFANTVGRNQGYYLTGRAVVTGGPNVTASLQKLKVSQFNGTFNSTIINAVGSKPGFYDIIGNNVVTIPTQQVVTGKAVVFNIPATTSKPVNVGPIFPNSTASQILISVGKAVANVKATIDGKVVPVTITCPAVTPQLNLAFTTVTTSTSTKTIGPNADYKPVTNLPVNSLIGSTGFNYSCAVAVSPGNFSIPISLTCFANTLTVKRSAKFSFQNCHATLNITQAAAQKLQAALPAGIKASSFDITVNNIALTGKGINPTSVKVLSAPVTSNKTTLTSSQAVYLVDIPGKNGLLPPVNFTAASTPQVALLYLGSTQAQIRGYNSAGQVLATLDAECAAPLSNKFPLIPVTIV